MKLPDLVCGNCDVCLTKVEQEDGTELAQKVLSAVSRLNERFGTGYIIDFLRGSASEKIQEQHKQLKTFGIGAEISKERWSNVVRDLLAQDTWSRQKESTLYLNLLQKAKLC
jgi:ATP-dependent DNA helicase RecQ